VEEEEDLGGIGVSFCQSEQVQVVVSDVEVLRVRESAIRNLEPGDETSGPHIDALVGEARRYR
jgi:hypothetical protein